MKSQIEVAVGIVIDGSQVLVTRRPSGSHLEGLWEFPGGKLEPGETPAVCLRRELREETGLEVEVVRELSTLSHDYPERSVRLHFILCRIAGGELDPTRHQARWIESEALPSLPMPAANAPIIQMLAGSAGQSRTSIAAAEPS